MNKQDILKEIQQNVKGLSDELNAVQSTNEVDTERLSTEIHLLLKLVHRFEWAAEKPVEPIADEPVIEQSEEPLEQEEVVVVQEDEIAETPEEAAAQLEQEMQGMLSSFSAQKPNEEVVNNIEKANSSEVTSIADRLSNSAIQDLTKAIGISEKFLYMNELFEGDSEAYKSYLKALNEQHTKELAFATLTEIGKKYNWDDENEYVQKFTKMVERRYS